MFVQSGAMAVLCGWPTVICFLTLVILAWGIGEELEGGDGGQTVEDPSWVVNNPPFFKKRAKERTMGHSNPRNTMVDMRDNSTAMTTMTEMLEERLRRTDGFTDGEVVDAMEHFFWGQFGGIAMELGSLDGSHDTRSMTRDYEDSMGWKRILIDGSPVYTKSLAQKSPEAFGVVAAICEKEKETAMHFSPKEYVGGILEFMAKPFLKEYHNEVWKLGTPEGELSNVDWSKTKNIKEVPCVPMSSILRAARVRHINYFILDVEGGELEVLKSINWHQVKFDVLCIETEAENRPPNFEKDVVDFLHIRGYTKDGPRQGRNTWFVRKDFEKFAKPGMARDCYNGARKGKREDDWYLNRKTPPFTKCPMDD